MGFKIEVVLLDFGCEVFGFDLIEDERCNVGILDMLFFVIDN